MKRITKGIMVGMVMSLFFGLSAQAAVKNVDITSPKSNAIVWIRKGTVKVPVKVKTTVTNGTKKDVTYKSSNTKLASIDAKGLLTVKKAGKVTITVTSKSDKKKSDKITLNVKQKITTVTPSKKSANLYVGSKTKLTATYAPKTSLFDRWGFASSNTKVATVDKNGNVVAKKAGTAVITVKAYDGVNNGYDTAANVTINVKPRYVSSIKATSKEIKIGKGGTEVLVTKVSPSNATNKALTYKSSNTKVAKVSSQGLVTAVNKGTATITITTADGSKKTAKVTVKVGSTEPVKSVKLNVKRKTITVGGARTKSAGTVSPADATIKSAKYASSNSKVASVASNGMITPVSAGTAKITYTVTDGNGRVKSASVNITVIQRVKSVTLAPTSLTLYTDKAAGAVSSKLVAKVAPSNASNKDVGFTSSDTSVASVKPDGTVTAKKAGTTTITVKTEDGGKTAKTTVKVVGVKVDTLKVADQTISSPVTLKINGSTKWTNPVAARKELNRLVGDIVKFAGSTFPEAARNFTISYKNNSYNIKLSVDGFSITDKNGKDAFEALNGKYFGEVVFNFGRGPVDSQLMGKLLDGIRMGFAGLRNTYTFDSALTVTRGTTVLNFSNIVLKDSAATFTMNGAQASVGISMDNELVIKNAPTLTDTIISVFNGYIVKK